jgi:hypothetical protein
MTAQIQDMASDDVEGFGVALLCNPEQAGDILLQQKSVSDERS